jgi:hypothetical protein
MKNQLTELVLKNITNVNLVYNQVNSVYYYFKFDGGISCRMLYRLDNNEIVTVDEITKKHNIKLSKKDDPYYQLMDLFDKIVDKLSRQDITKQSHPKHIRVTYNIKTKKLDFESSYVEMFNHIYIEKGPISNMIYDEWVEELKTGIKGKYFYLTKEDEKYWIDPKTGRQRKLPKVETDLVKPIDTRIKLK